MRFLPFLFVFLLMACGTSGDSDSAAVNPTHETDTAITEEIAVETPVIEDIPEIEEDTIYSGEFDNIDWEEFEASMTQDFSFVILISTKSYASALERAKDASEKLGYPLDLRDLHENEEIGLSLPREVCEEEICGGGLEYPIYIPRSDWGDSKYVSIEYSNAFGGFTKGYYMVIVASGEKGDPIIDEALQESKQFYEDAYAKTCGVWMGCGC